MIDAIYAILEYSKHSLYLSTSELFTVIFFTLGLLGIIWFLFQVITGRDQPTLRVVLIMLFVAALGGYILESSIFYLILVALLIIVNAVWVIRISIKSGWNTTLRIAYLMQKEITLDLAILLIAVPTTFFTIVGRMSQFYSTAVIIWFNALFLYNYINLIICIVSPASRETLLERKLGIYCSMACMVPSITMIILVYGNLYTITGLKIEGVIYKDPNLQSAVYYSIVTWTTLGYGDITPLESSRVYAAAEAINGYVIFSFLTSALIASVTGLYNIFQSEKRP